MNMFANQRINSYYDCFQLMSVFLIKEVSFFPEIYTDIVIVGNRFLGTSRRCAYNN